MSRVGRPDFSINMYMGIETENALVAKLNASTYVIQGKIGSPRTQYKTFFSDKS